MEGLTELEFNQYNLLINSLYLTNDYFNENRTTRGWWQWAGCGVAIAANAVITYSLVACVVPNPSIPAACGVAIAEKALAYAGIAFGCIPHE